MRWPLTQFRAPRDLWPSVPIREAPRPAYSGRASIADRGLVLTVHVYACSICTMRLMSLPCYCATLRQAARAVTVLYEGILGDSGLHATQFTALQFLDAA